MPAEPDSSSNDVVVEGVQSIIDVIFSVCTASLQSDFYDEHPEAIREGEERRFPQFYCATALLLVLNTMMNRFERQSGLRFDEEWKRETQEAVSLHLLNPVMLRYGFTTICEGDVEVASTVLSVIDGSDSDGDLSEPDHSGASGDPVQV